LSKRPDKSHPSFQDVKDKALKIFGRENQLSSGKTFNVPNGEDVSSSLVNTDMLGYFMARTQLFMEEHGLDPEKLRFRQHLTTEMTHYATDCWDLEMLTSYGWIDCVGHADACYDL
jgi:glycyl-tRNA synthetase